MRRRIPLNAIRAFEAVARHTSVVRAADELLVTPTAVGHQVRVLEDFLQIPLFDRRSNRMYPTSEALAGLSKISHALDLIDDAVIGMKPSAECDRRLSVNTSSSLGSLWLIPNMPSFLKQEPGIELHISTFVSRREADTQSCDLRICNWQSQADFRSEMLFEEQIIPVCAPFLAEQYGGRGAALLREAPLLHVDRLQSCYDGALVDWSLYLSEAGISRPDASLGLRFNQAATAVEATRAGVGVMLGRSLVVERALQHGQLVVVGDPFPTSYPYYMQTPTNTVDTWKVRSFRNWLMAMVQRQTSIGLARC
jgi:LysR family glycine cleavage system transcriptional activator